MNINIKEKIDSWLAKQKITDEAVKKLQVEPDLHKELAELVARENELLNELNRPNERVDIGGNDAPKIRVEVKNKEK